MFVIYGQQGDSVLLVESSWQTVRTEDAFWFDRFNLLQNEGKFIDSPIVREESLRNARSPEDSRGLGAEKCLKESCNECRTLEGHRRDLFEAGPGGKGISRGKYVS